MMSSFYIVIYSHIFYGDALICNLMYKYYIAYDKMTVTSVQVS